MKIIIVIVIMLMVGVEAVSMYFMFGRGPGAPASRPSARAEEEFMTIKGKVVDWNAKAVPNVHVFIEPDYNAPVVTDANGKFEFINVPLGIPIVVGGPPNKLFNLVVEGGILADGVEYVESSIQSGGEDVVLKLVKK